MLLWVCGWGQIGAFYGKQRCFGVVQSLFYGSEGVRLKINCCRVIGAWPSLNQPGYNHYCALPKKGGIWEEGQIHFVGKPVFLQLDWVEPI